MNKPKDAEYLHDGIFYKRGIHDLVFMHIGDKWTRSQKPWSEIVRGRK